MSQRGKDVIGIMVALAFCILVVGAGVLYANLLHAGRAAVPPGVATAAGQAVIAIISAISSFIAYMLMARRSDLNAQLTQRSVEQSTKETREAVQQSTAETVDRIANGVGEKIAKAAASHVIEHVAPRIDEVTEKLAAQVIPELGSASVERREIEAATIEREESRNGARVYERGGS